MLAAIKRRSAATATRILLPLNEFEPLLALALQQDEPLLRDDGRCGNFRSAGFQRALAFYVEMFHERLGAARSQTRQISNVWNEFGRGYFAFYISGPWNIGEFKRRLPADAAGQLDDGAASRTRRPGRVDRRRLQPGGVSRVARTRTAAWQLIEYLSQPRRAARASTR